MRTNQITKSARAPCFENERFFAAFEGLAHNPAPADEKLDEILKRLRSKSFVNNIF